MSDTFIFANDVSFNYPITNITQILPVYTTDTILNISCKTLDISGILTANNMSCTNIINVNNVSLGRNDTNPSITIYAPLVPTYTYNLTNGTNIEGTIGYIYSKTTTFTNTLIQNTNTDIIGDFNTGINIKGGVYISKLDITYRNTFSAQPTTPVKIQHEINAAVFQNVMYFVNNTNNYIYSNTFILFIGEGQQITHNCMVPQSLVSISNINVSIVNGQYTLRLLKIA